MILIVITPLGMIAEGEAWGEWDLSQWPVPATWKSIAAKLAEIYKAPLPDYNIPGWDNGILPYVGYIISALLGTAILIILTYIIGYYIIKGRRHG
jgi:hypothetical protein